MLKIDHVVFVLLRTAWIDDILLLAVVQRPRVATFDAGAHPVIAAAARQLASRALLAASVGNCRLVGLIAEASCELVGLDVHALGDDVFVVQLRCHVTWQKRYRLVLIVLLHGAPGLAELLESWLGLIGILAPVGLARAAEAASAAGVLFDKVGHVILCLLLLLQLLDRDQILLEAYPRVLRRGSRAFVILR